MAAQRAEIGNAVKKQWSTLLWPRSKGDFVALMAICLPAMTALGLVGASRWLDVYWDVYWGEGWLQCVCRAAYFATLVLFVVALVRCERLQEPTYRIWLIIGLALMVLRALLFPAVNVTYTSTGPTHAYLDAYDRAAGTWFWVLVHSGGCLVVGGRSTASDDGPRRVKTMTVLDRGLRSRACKLARPALGGRPRPLWSAAAGRRFLPQGDRGRQGSRVRRSPGGTGVRRRPGLFAGTTEARSATSLKRRRAAALQSGRNARRREEGGVEPPHSKGCRTFPGADPFRRLPHRAGRFSLSPARLRLLAGSPMMMPRRMTGLDEEDGPIESRRPGERRNG